MLVALSPVVASTVRGLSLRCHAEIPVSRGVSCLFRDTWRDGGAERPGRNKVGRVTVGQGAGPWVEPVGGPEGPVELAEPGLNIARRFDAMVDNPINDWRSFDKYR